MSPNQQTVTDYMAAFRRTDHEAILACLTDDVEWIIPGFFRIEGKPAFDREIENDAFIGHPDITVTRLIEQDNLVVAEGAVRSQRKDGGTLNLAFCDVFEMQNHKIRRLISYLVEIRGNC